MLKTSLCLVISLVVTAAFAWLLPPSHGQAIWPVEFSADQVVYRPDHPEQVIRGKLYVGKAKMRTEMDTPGGSMVTIVDPEKKSI